MVKTSEINPYQNLEAGIANILKPIEDFCTKFFVGTEVKGNCRVFKLHSPVVLYDLYCLLFVHIFMFEYVPLYLRFLT
jgi:hypothetical protein